MNIMKVNGQHYRTVWFDSSTHSVKMIEQNKLPFQFEIADLKDHVETANAIKIMTVRGAGAIGAAAGYAMAQAFLESSDIHHWDTARQLIEASRPTAQNLFYATKRVYEAGMYAAYQGSTPAEAALKEAEVIANEDIEFCRLIGEHGEKLFDNNFKILTHCNAGWLAFVDIGSATAPIYGARDNGKQIFVFTDETRPRNQGARLTAWELNNEGIPHKIIADNVSAFLMKKGMINACIVGCDRVASNGDVANKIGTLEKAIAAEKYGIPFYVATPLSTIDLKCPSGEQIPIEERGDDEVLYQSGPDEKGEMHKIRVASPGSSALNYAFDVTDASLITGLITPKGVIKPNRDNIRKLFE